MISPPSANTGFFEQELIEEYEKKHGGDDKEAGGSKRKGGADSGEPKSKSAKKPDTRY